MALNLRVSPAQDTGQTSEPEGWPVYTISVTVTDTEHPLVAATFDYLAITVQTGPRLYGMRIHPPDGLPVGDYARLNATSHRDYPLATWERLAAGAVGIWQAKLPAPEELNGTEDHEKAKEEKLRAWRVGIVRRAAVAVNDLDPNGLVDQLYPELRNATTPAGVRRRKSLTRMVDIAVRYERHRWAGEPDPASLVARELDMKPVSLRSWIHRARKEGLIGRPHPLKT